MTTDTPTTPAPRSRGTTILRRGAIGFGLVAGGFVLGAGTLASAAGGMPWHDGFHRGPRIGMIQHMLHGALENVGATTAQEAKIHDIVAETWTDLDKDKDGRDAMRKQVLDLLRAPTIDRAAVEKLRADKIADMDAKSKTIAAALLDAAGQLTPDQRGKLVQQVEARMDHPRWGDWRHDGEMGEQGGTDSGPDKGTQSAPDDNGDH